MVKSAMMEDDALLHETVIQGNYRQKSSSIIFTLIACMSISLPTVECHNVLFSSSFQLSKDQSENKCSRAQDTECLDLTVRSIILSLIFNVCA